MTALADGMAFVEIKPSFYVTVQRDKKSTREERGVGVPYLAAKMIALKNGGKDTLKTKISRVSSLSSDIYLCQYDAIITPDGAWVKNSNGNDTSVTTVFVQTRSLKIDTIVLDQSSQYYTYYRIWNGNNIQPHVLKLEHSFEEYAEFDNKVESIIPNTKINSVNWGLMVDMTMVCGKK